MSKKREMPNSSVLLKLYNNKMLVSKVNEALDDKKTYEYIIGLCKEYSFDITKSSLTRYKEKRRESMETGVDLAELLDKRRKSGNIVDIKSKEKLEPLEVLTNNSRSQDGELEVYNDIEVLDEIIKKGMVSLQHAEVVDIPIAIRAMEVKAKITGNQLQGVSLVGLRELKLRNMAKESAMTEVLLKYIPEDKHEEVLDAMEKAEKEFYANLDLTEEDKRINKSLGQLGEGF